MSHVVIIGAGQAGFQVAASLRDEGHDGPITLIGDEACPPYQRPPLSKTYLKDGCFDALRLRPDSFYERCRIRLLAARRVIAIDRAARAVTLMQDGVIGYDHLVLATGARNIAPPIAGLAGRDVFGLRGVADADRLRAALGAGPRRPLVIGGGFIGLEFAAAVAAAGHRVTVVEAADRLMARALSPAMSARFQHAHAGQGTAIRLGATVAAVQRGPMAEVVGVTLGDGQSIGADMILVAAGVTPNTGLAEAAGLAVANGIVVDALMCTTDPAISALGDCAAFPDPLTGRQVRIESVQAATDQARTIARRLAGRASPYEAIPWFWSDQGPLKLQIAGLGHGADDDHVLDKSQRSTLVFRFKLGKLVALETTNAAAAHMAARQLLKSPEGVSRCDLAACAFDVSGLAKQRKVPR